MATQSATAAHIDLSERRFRDLEKRGILPPSKGRGGYDIDACRVAYIRHLRGIKAGQHDEQGEQLSVSRTRADLQVEQAKKIRFQNLEFERRLVDINQVQEVFYATTVMLSTVLDGVAGRLASGDALLRQRLLNEHRRIRETFAERLEAYANGPGGGGPDASSTKPNSRRVG